MRPSTASLLVQSQIFFKRFFKWHFLVQYSSTFFWSRPFFVKSIKHLKCYFVVVLKMFISFSIYQKVSNTVNKIKIPWQFKTDRLTNIVTDRQTVLKRMSNQKDMCVFLCVWLRAHWKASYILILFVWNPFWYY